MSKGAEIVKLAESKLGTRGAEAKAYCGLPSNSNYCDAFVSWLYYKCGVRDYYCDGTKQTYCPTSIVICRKTMPNIPPYIALEGDVIFFDWEPNGNPNHVGIVRGRKSSKEILTVEGNTSKQNSKGQTIATGVVANKTRTVTYVQGIYRPQFPIDADEFDTSKPLETDGFFGYNSIAMLQRALMVKVDAILGLNTVKALQRLVGVTADGSWGVKTSKAVQKLIGVEQDGEFGPNSVKALQKWLNKQAGFTGTATGSTTKPSSASKLRKKIIETCKVQAEWMKNYTYDWSKWKPRNVEMSKKYGTCVTYVACVLQRLGYLKSGECIWHTGKGYGTGKVYGTNSKMSVKYMNNAQFGSLKDKLEEGDIILVDDNKSGISGNGGHIMIFAGKWTASGLPYVYDNHSAERVKRGQNPVHTYGKTRKVLARVRLK